MDTPAGSGEDFAGPSFDNLRQLPSQLDQWRIMLPVQLQWPDEDSAIFHEQCNTSDITQTLQILPLPPVAMSHRARPYSRPISIPAQFCTHTHTTYKLRC
jgi:hypothetical protein